MKDFPRSPSVAEFPSTLEALPTFRLRSFAASAVFLAMLFSLPFCPERAAAEVSVGDKAPMISLLAADGKSFSLAEELSRRVVLLEFVSPNCKPCVDSRPWVDRLLLGFGKDEPVGLVSVMLGKEGGTGISRPDDRGRRESRLQGDEAVAEAYGVYGTPVFLLLDRNGTVVWKHVGRLTSSATDRALDAAAAAAGVALAPSSISAARPGDVHKP